MVCYNTAAESSVVNENEGGFATELSAVDLQQIVTKKQHNVLILHE